MTTTVNYYGMIADKLSKSSEELEFNMKNDSINLRTHFEDMYPVLKEMSYKIAINQEFREILKETDTIKEIAFLPPFAGG